MAVKVNNLVVIDDQRKLQNIVGASGIYDAFEPKLTLLTGTVLDISLPLMVKNLTANTTFTAANLAVGKSSILILDLSESSHTPTFPSSVKWPGSSLPNWSLSRYWIVSLFCWDGSTIVANATSYVQAAGGETVGLTPDAISAFTLEVDPEPTASWDVNSNGFIFGQINTVSPVATSQQWVSPAPPINSYWIRATAAGQQPSTGTTGSWLSLSVNRSWTWVGRNIFSSLIIEIASDAAGATVVGSTTLDVDVTSDSIT